MSRSDFASQEISGNSYSSQRPIKTCKQDVFHLRNVLSGESGWEQINKVTSNSFPKTGIAMRVISRGAYSINPSSKSVASASFVLSLLHWPRFAPVPKYLKLPPINACNVITVTLYRNRHTGHAAR